MAAEPAPNRATFGRNYDGSATVRKAVRLPDSGCLALAVAALAHSGCAARRDHRAGRGRPPHRTCHLRHRSGRVLHRAQADRGPGRLRTPPFGRDLALRQRGQPGGFHRRPGGLYAAVRRLRSGWRVRAGSDARHSRRFGSCTTSASISSTQPMRGRPSSPIRQRVIAAAAARWAAVKSELAE